MAMMNQLRLEQQSDIYSCDGSVAHTPVPVHNDARQDSKKRDRKRTPTKSTAGRTHEGRGRSHNRHNKDSHNTITQHATSHPSADDRRTGMEIDCWGNSDSEFSAVPQRDLFASSMDSDSRPTGLLTQANTPQSRLPTMEAKSKNV